MATLKDVAKLACVDVSTVSRALNNTSYVHPDTKARILAAVKQLSYHPNVLARGLRQGKRHTIGVIVPLLHMSVFAGIIQGLDQEAQKAGYAILLCSSYDNPAVEKECLNRLRNGFIDGLIIAATDRNSRLIQDIQASGTPVIQIIREQIPRLSSIVADYEATGYEAMTIHRLLGVRAVREEGEGPLLPDAEFGDRGGGGSFSFFEKGRDNPLEADAIIIDEMSMVDMHLFCSLLKAVMPGTRLILVGDVNQLPSVGPGRVLQDLISSGVFRTVMLRKIFRQAMESDIVTNAHRILGGELPQMSNKSRDFFFLERDSAPVIYKHTVELMRDKLPGYLHCETGEIQVLTPMRKGPLGVSRLNEVLQSVLNPPAKNKREVQRQDVTFREGDKVMQTRNNYQIEWVIRGNYGLKIDSGTGVFNGDAGIIQNIDNDAEIVTVCFDEEKIVEYPFSELEDLEPAYAVTVHKSQGSEYPAVILPLLSGPSGLFNRNLLYTAVTRARDCVVILGSRQTVASMTANVRENRRYTGLKERIHEIFAVTDADPRSGLSQEMSDL